MRISFDDYELDYLQSALQSLQLHNPVNAAINNLLAKIKTARKSAQPQTGE